MLTALTYVVSVLLCGGICQLDTEHTAFKSDSCGALHQRVFVIVAVPALLPNHSVYPCYAPAYAYC